MFQTIIFGIYMLDFGGCNMLIFWGSTAFFQPRKVEMEEFTKLVFSAPRIL